MREWKYMEQSEGLVLDGEENITIVGTDIDGWNDNINFSDTTRLAYVELVRNDETKVVNTFISYFFEEVRNDKRVLKLVDEAIADLQKELASLDD